MKALTIASKDLQVLLRDRGALFLLLLLPFVFIVPFALMGEQVSLSPTGGAEALPLTVANSDPQGAYTQALLAAVAAAGQVKVTQADPARVEEQLNLSTLRYALFIPADFSAKLAAGEQATLRLRLHPLTDESRVAVVERAVVRAARDLMLNDYLDQGLEQMKAMQAANPAAEGAFSEARIRLQVERQQARASEQPLVSVVETTLAALRTTEPVKIPALGQFLVVGMAVLAVFLTAQNTAASFFKEKRLGSFRRLMAAPVSKAALLGGKMLPGLIVGLVQVALILVTGGYLIQFLGSEPLDLSSDPLALALVSLAMVVCSTSLGVCLAALAKTESQVTGVGSMALFLCGLLAGSFIPLFLFPEGLANMARVVPHYWANQALYGLVFRGQTLSDVWPDIAVLLAFALAFFGIGLWRFKFE